MFLFAFFVHILLIPFDHGQYCLAADLAHRADSLDLFADDAPLSLGNRNVLLFVVLAGQQLFQLIVFFQLVFDFRITISQLSDLSFARCLFPLGSTFFLAAELTRQALQQLVRKLLLFALPILVLLVQLLFLGDPFPL